MKMVDLLNKDQRKKRGDLAELVACNYLENMNYQIIHKKWRCKIGEIDIIALDQDIIVFIEVRSRYLSSQFGSAIESIDLRKQRKLKAVAMQYLHFQHMHHHTVRFDCITVEWKIPNASPMIKLFKNAF
jgi:putative endonuclease